MADKFEHQIADQVSGFQLTPSAQVWKGVALELDKEKTRKRPFIWWILFGLLGMGIAGILILIFNQEPKSPNAIYWKKDAQKAFPKITDSINDSASINSNNKNEEIPNKKSDAITQIVGQSSKFKEPIAKTQSTQDNDQKKDSKESVDKSNSISEQANTIVASPQQTNSNSLATDTTVVLNTSSKSSKNNASIIQEQANLKDSNISTVSTRPLVSKKINTSIWRFVLALGSTRFSENSLLGNTVAADPNAFNNNGSVIVSGLPSSNTIVSAEKGFHAEIGISRIWKWSKRWELEAGLSYRYLQNQQTTGIKKDSTYSINSQATTNNQALNLSSYYLAGNDLSSVNSAHWLMIPMQIHFNLNPSSKINWLVYGGANLSWNISSNWLLPDQANKILYASRPLTNIWGMHFQTGMQIRNAGQQSLSFGWEKSINSLSKLSQSKQYWNQFQLKYSQPIYFKKSSKK